MQPLPGPKPKLEKDHHREIKAHMEKRGWLVLKVTGSIYMVGWPDIYATHKEHGARWIETKRPTTGKLSPEQIKMFAKLTEYGAGVWILEKVEEYPRLFGQPNWWRWTVKEFKL